MSKIKKENYFVVWGWMTEDLKLKGTERDVYAVIYGFYQNKEGDYTGSIAYLMDFTGMKRTAVINALVSLTNKKYLYKKTENKNGINYVTYSINTAILYEIGVNAWKNTNIYGKKYENSINRQKKCEYQYGTTV